MNGYSDNLGMTVYNMPERIRLVEMNDLRRAELVMLPEDRLDEIREYISARELKFSFHYPLFQPAWLEEDALHFTVLDPDRRRREILLGLLEENLDLCRQWGAEYFVVHLQRPDAIISPEERKIKTPASIMDLALEMCERLDTLSKESGVEVHLENLLGNKYFYHWDSYLKVLEFPNLHLCLDIGHLDIDSKLYRFSLTGFVRAVLPHVRSIHLSNARIDGEMKELDAESFRNLGRKIPVHPSQNPDEGWIDVEGFLRTVLRSNPDCVVNFEAYFRMFGFDFTREGIDWVRGICDEVRAYGAEKEPT